MAVVGKGCECLVTSLGVKPSQMLAMTGVSHSLSDRHSVEQMASGLCEPARLELIDEINEWNEAQEPFLVKK